MRHKISGPGKKLAESGLFRCILICIGWLSVLGGVIGIFLPLLPTVPLLLLAAACFSKSSERFHNWLIEHYRLGPFIRDYLKGGGIPSRARNTALGMIWISFPASAFLYVQAIWIRVLLLLMAAGITLYLLNIPTKRPGDKGE
jgi:uncharacterized protein